MIFRLVFLISQDFLSVKYVACIHKLRHVLTEMIGAAVRARGPPFNLFAAVRNQEFANFKQKTRSKKLSFYEKKQR